MAAKSTELEIRGLITDANTMITEANRLAEASYNSELNVKDMRQVLSTLDKRAELIKAKRVEIEEKIAKLRDPHQAEQLRNDLHAISMATPLISRDLLAAKCKLTELKELKHQQTEAMLTFQHRSLVYTADPKTPYLTRQMLAQDAAGIDTINLAVDKLNIEATAIFSPFKWKSGSQFTTVQREKLEQLQEEHKQLLIPNANDENLRLIVAAQQIIAFDRRFDELMRSFNRADDRSINEQKLTEMRDLKDQIAIRMPLIKQQLEKRIKSESRPEERKQLAAVLEQLVIIRKALEVDRKTNSTSYDRVIERTAERMGMPTQALRQNYK